MSVDKQKIQQAVKMILEAIGEDPSREGLKDTPDRVARMYEELTVRLSLPRFSRRAAASL